jgi:hypothetical protein
MSTRRRLWEFERATNNFVVYSTKLDDPNKTGVIYIPRCVFASHVDLHQNFPKQLDLITGSKPKYTRLSASSVAGVAKTLQNKKEDAQLNGFADRAAAFEEAMRVIEQYGRIEA